MTKTKLLIKAEVNGTWRVVRNATIAVQLKQLIDIWQSFKMLLINCKVKLILRWRKSFALSVAANDNDSATLDKIIFYYQRIICSSCGFISKTQAKTMKILRRGFDKSVYWNEYKTKSETKNITNEYRYFLESNFVVVKKVLVLVYLN